MKLPSSSKGYLFIAISGVFYGFNGLFVELLSTYNMSTNVMGFYRSFIAFLAIFTYLFIWKREDLKVEPRALLYIAIFGFTSQTLFNQLYFATIEETTIATAVVLLYTAPIFVVVIARFLYKELFTSPKLIALVISVTGCFLTTTGGSLEGLRLNSTGLILGISTGFTFALLPIVSKGLVRKYNHLTILCYALGFGALFSLAFFDPRTLFLIDYNVKIGANLIGLGVFSNALANLFYMVGMSYSLESSKVSIINTVEVPVAVLVSFIIFQEHIFGVKLLGIIMVLLSVVIIEYGQKLWPMRSDRGKERI